MPYSIYLKIFVSRDILGIYGEIGIKIEKWPWFAENQLQTILHTCYESVYGAAICLGGYCALWRLCACHYKTSPQ